jgi:GntR family transcriptional regulator/MocR family aminotransferase
VTHCSHFVASLSLEWDRESSIPLFRQLYTCIREAILSGQLEGGTRLPPTRELAEQLHISRNTVINAFEQLIAEGYLEGKVGAGTYVANSLPEEVLQARVNIRHLPGARDEQPPAISQRGQLLTASMVAPVQYASPPRAFQPGLPAIDQFPFDTWSKLATYCWRNPPPELLSYGDPHGYRPLREAIASYLKAARGVKCEADQVVIVSGSQQALDLTARILLDPGDSVCIEDPGYMGARHAFVGAGAQLVPVAVDDEGLQVETARAHDHHIRLVYVTPSHQYPMGVTMSLVRRLTLLEWATRKGMWIVEDDYDSEYRYTGRPLAALQGLDETGRVIYIGTFSKVLLPSLRLGYLVVPPALTETFVKVRALADRHSPSIDQAILAQFMQEGHFTRHIRRMKKLYMERQAVLVEAVKRELDGILLIPPTQGGLHVAGRLVSDIDDRLVSQRAQRFEIDTPPLSAYGLGQPTLNGLVLGYAGIEPESIRAGVKRLARAILAISSEKRA